MCPPSPTASNGPPEDTSPGESPSGNPHGKEAVTNSTDSENADPAPEYCPPPMQCEATQLMTEARTGAPEAFESLFSKVRGGAFQAARSLVGNYEDAQDLTQEAFVKAYRARESYDPAQPFFPWFHRILRNTCFSFLRKKGRLRERSIHARANAQGDGDETWEIIDPRAAAPSAGAEARETTEVFTEALDKLSARDREIIVLRHYQELSYKEIAAALGVPEGTVMSRLFHARKRIKALLASQVEDLVNGHEALTAAKLTKKGAKK